MYSIYLLVIKFISPKVNRIAIKGDAFVMDVYVQVEISGFSKNEDSISYFPHIRNSDFLPPYDMMCVYRTFIVV